MNHCLWRYGTVAAALFVAVPRATVAQHPTPSGDTTKAPVAAPAAPRIDFSGVLFGNYQYQRDSTARASRGGKSPNKFDIERVYLTFRMPVGDRASIRATTDIFQQANAANGFYTGWVVRLKYGYLQYDFARDIGGRKGFNASGRIGMLHTVVVDHLEGFWPRYLGQVAVERNGFFSSADMGAAGLLSLPNEWGEAYGTVTNGPGYTSGEQDRFKDAALRLSLTPLRARGSSGYLSTLTITPWVYKGFTGSRFQSGGAGQLGAVTEGLTRDRWGVFAGLKDRRLTLGTEYDRRTDETEGGSNTAAAPRTVAEATGRVVSAFALARPLEWADPARKSPFGVIARVDDVKPNTSAAASPDATDRFVVGGLFWEPTPRTSLALDYQSRSPRDGSTNPDQKTLFLHWQATF